MPQLTTNACTKLDTTLVARLDRIAEREGVSRSYLIKAAVEYFIWAKVYRRRDNHSQE